MGYLTNDRKNLQQISNLLRVINESDWKIISYLEKIFHCFVTTIYRSHIIGM